MKDIKSTGRDIQTGVKKNVRAIDGTSPSDRVANTGDEIRKNLGNAGDRARSGAKDLGDTARHAARNERVVRDDR